MLVPVMTVAENIVLGQEPKRAGGMLDLAGASARVRELSDRYGLAVEPRRPHRGRHRRRAAARRDPARAVPGRADPRPRRAHGGPHRPGGHRAHGRDPPPQAGRDRDRVHQPQAPRGAPGGRPHHRAAAGQEGGHRPARGRHRAQPGPARGRSRRAAGRREARVQEAGRHAARGARSSTYATTASCPPSTGCRCRCAPGRSSPSPASTATASRSSSRRSPGCAFRSWAPSPSTGATSPGPACVRPPRPASPTSPRTATGAASCSRSRLPRTSPCASIAARCSALGAGCASRRMRERAGRLLREFDVRGGGPETYAAAAVGRQPAEGLRRA